MSNRICCFLFLFSQQDDLIIKSNHYWLSFLRTHFSLYQKSLKVCYRALHLTEVTVRTQLVITPSVIFPPYLLNSKTVLRMRNRRTKQTCLRGSVWAAEVWSVAVVLTSLVWHETACWWVHVWQETSSCSAIFEHRSYWNTTLAVTQWTTKRWPETEETQNSNDPELHECACVSYLKEHPCRSLWSSPCQRARPTLSNTQ